MAQPFKSLVFALLVTWILMPPDLGSFPLAASKVWGEDAEAREPWNQSRFIGTPDPPLPLVLEQAYPQQEFKGPVAVAALPESDRLVVVEQKGKIYSFSQAHAEKPADLMADFESSPPLRANITAGAGKSLDVYSITFHPQFKTNRWAYVCYVVLPTSPQDPTGTHIARFHVSDEAIPRLESESELTILTCGGGGHNGCTLAFGPDGMLYVSIGDLEVPTPPDRLNTGQDITDLYASILRIDVDHPEKDRPYSIPKDNPFVNISGARGEVYAFGFRNPWRMSFDSVTGDLWVGDVGWEMYEMVYRVRSGGNYGWSIKEGPGDVKPNGTLGPTPILPPDIYLSHADAASVTGGFVYRGKKIPELVGEYIFGDWITRRFWSAKFDSQKVTQVREIASTHVKPICFAIDHDGELLVLDYSNVSQKAGLYRFRANPELREFRGNSQASFPMKLSDSGLFSDTEARKPAQGVFRYELNSTMWSDGASAEYLLALPGKEQAVFHQEGQTTFDWFKTKVQFPVGTVLAKTYTVPSTLGKDSPPIPVETQIAHFAGSADWRFYSYRWNKEQTDADLVPANGDQRSLEIPAQDSANSKQKLEWKFASRAQCRTCHTSWAGESLGLLEGQLRRPKEPHDSWRTMLAQGYARLGPGKKPLPDEQFSPMASVYDIHAPLGIRARSYLHVNCSHCHMYGAVGSSALDFPFEKSLDETKSIDQTPMKGDFGLPGAKLIAAGAPTRSLVWYRMAKTGTGRMPHMGAQTSDPAGVQLIHDWIVQLPNEASHRDAIDRLTAPVGKFNDKDRMAAVERLLGDLEGGLLLAHAYRNGMVPKHLRKAVMERGLQSNEVIRDAMEPMASEDQRVARLGSGFDPAIVLNANGDIERGKLLFQRGVGQCNQCHRLEGEAKSTGPNLSEIGKKYTREKLLTQIIAPSATIDPNYQATVIVLTDGSTQVGRVVKRSEKELLLQPATGDPKKIEISDIEFEKVSDRSLMPEELLAGLTKDQAADLLAYLASLK